MTDDVQLTTTRLVLKPIRLEEFNSWVELLADEDVMRFLGGPKSRLGTVNLSREIGGDGHFDGCSCFSIFERPHIRRIGYAGISRREGLPSPELIIGVIRDRRQYGYDFEASSVVLGWAFETLGLPEVISCIPPDHAVFERTARRLGGIYRGSACLPTLVPDEELLVDIVVFSRKQWLARSYNDSPDFFAPRC